MAAQLIRLQVGTQTVAKRADVGQRVINGRAICAGDCPMFEASGLPLIGRCRESRGQYCHVGQLCYTQTTVGGTRYPFARFAMDPSRHRVRRQKVIEAETQTGGKLLPFPRRPDPSPPTPATPVRISPARRPQPLEVPKPRITPKRVAAPQSKRRKSA